MLTYAAIAVGGALGTMARFWMGLVVARWTGPDFPWGTIAINILGSFLIGLFATATAGDGRLPLSADARNLLIVGLCGGFTTFSSFSLQTLELLRAGRPGWALANVGVSVAICLGAVAAGYYLGEVTRPTRVERVEITAAAPDRVILIVLEDPRTTPALLAASTRLVELGMARSVMALGVKMPAPEPLVPSEEVGTAERRMHRKAHEENWFGQIATMVERWMQPIIAQGIGAEWLGVEGNAAPSIAKEGKRADAIVLGSRGLPGAELGQHLHAALFGAGAAALVLPPGHEGPIGDIVAIAWQDDGRAQRAVESALPILRQARQIHVLRAGPQARAAGSLPDVLASNRLAAQLHFVPARHEDTGQALLAAARGLGADLMVMGAYGHGEWREAMLGGVTRTMLAEADLPLLMRS